MNKIIFIIFLTVILFPSNYGRRSVSAGEIADDTSDEEMTLYQMKKGDTLRNLAGRFFGGKEFLPELLEYNKIQNPLLVGEGFMLILPGKARGRAIEALIKTREVFALAVDAKAEEFAKKEFFSAKEAIETAEESRRTGAYDQAYALAQLGLARAQYAIDLANKAATVQQGGKITAVHGLVEISRDDEQSWEPVDVGEEFATNEIIRTGEKSRTALTLDDGSVINLLESSKFNLRKFTYDLRDGRRTSQLQVILGSILGKIKPKQVRKSTFDVKSGSAALGIRGTELRVSTNLTQATHVSVLEGEIEMSANQVETVVPGNFGTFAKGNQPPAEPVELLGPPSIAWPIAEIYETSTQSVTFSWDHVRNEPKKVSQKISQYFTNKFASYRLEIAKDTLFNQIVENRTTKEEYLQTHVLPPGDYYWRVSSIDNNNLEGPYSEAKILRISRDLEIDIVEKIPPIKQDGKWIIGTDNMLEIIPRNEYSSVYQLELSLNEEPFQVFDGRIFLWEEGEYNLKVRGVGADDYIGQTVQKFIQVDGTPPIISHAVSLPRASTDLGEVVYVTFSAIDATGVETIEYSINNEDFQPYTEKITVCIDQKTGGIHFRGGDLFGKVVVDKHILPTLQIVIDCRAVDLLGNESFHTALLEY